METGVQAFVRDPNWTRGAARVEMGRIILEKPEPYSIAGIEPAMIIFDFAGIRTPADARTFASQYGLLKSRDAGYELYATWERDTALFREIIHMYIILQTAVAGDVDAVTFLRELLGSKLGPMDDQELLLHVTRLIAFAVTEGLEGDADKNEVTGVKLAAGETPGIFGLTADPITLRGLLYFGLAEQFFTRERMYECEECQRPFPVRDARQRFCSDSCASKMRHKRRVARQASS